jgi:hypothetical protein
MLAFKVHAMPFDIFAEFAGQPIWLWAAFLSFVGLVLWLDLGVRGGFCNGPSSVNPF